MTGLLVAAAVIALLAVLPLGISATYDCDGPLVCVVAGPVRIPVYPMKKKEKKKKEKKPVKKEKKQPAKKKAAPAKKKGGDLAAFLPLVETALKFLADFGRSLRINLLELHITMAGGDPCDLAVNYGKAWAAVGNLIPRLEQLLVIKKRQIRVDCDFTGSKNLVYGALTVTITLGKILYLAVRYGLRALRQYLQIKKPENKTKGGAKI